jgi:hypothetical protein
LPLRHADSIETIGVKSTPNNLCHKANVLCCTRHNPDIPAPLSLCCPGLFGKTINRSRCCFVPSRYIAKMGVSLVVIGSDDEEHTADHFYSELSEPKGSPVVFSEPTRTSTRTQQSLGTWTLPRRTVTSGVLLGRSFTTLDGGSCSYWSRVEEEGRNRGAKQRSWKIACIQDIEVMKEGLRRGLERPKWSGDWSCGGESC